MDTHDIVSAYTGGGDYKTQVDPSISQLRILQRAVVVDTLDNFSSKSEEKLGELLNAVKSSQRERLTDAPRNSILVKLCDDGIGRSEPHDVGLHIIYPFFSSHLALPLKPGEQVWVLFPNPFKTETQGYWLTRITTDVEVEDVNYTHYDRQGDPITLEEAKKIQDAEGNSEPPINPGFPNGPNYNLEDPDRYTLQATDAFESIVTESSESSQVIIEPVPRFTKRPGDLVLQGSNNTAIVLGTDRGYRETDPIKPDASNATPVTAEGDPRSLIPGKGAIDIVVGRGRLNVDLKTLAGSGDTPNLWPTAPDPEAKLTKPPGNKPSRTEPQVVENARNTFETDKNISLLDDKASNGLQRSTDPLTNASEGDPDFVNDATRLYLTMKSDPDDDFSLTPDKVPALFEGELAGVKQRAAAVVKSDEIRIVARKIGEKSPTLAAQPTEPNKSEPFNGSIRIIKEGDKKEDASSIYLLPDGTIQISGSKILLGRAAADDGAAPADGPGGSQPYIMYHELETLWNDLMAEIDKFATTAVGNTTPGFGAPSPQITQASTELKAAIGALKPRITEVKSKRIFGE